MSAHLEAAINPLRSRAVRLEAWIRYESEEWASSHIERALPMTSLPQSYDYCREMGACIFALLEAQIDFRLIRRAEPTGIVGNPT